MPRNFMQLILEASNDFARVKELQTLLKIGLHEADNPSEKSCDRIALLVATYLCQVEPHLEDLEIGLDKIRGQLSESGKTETPD